MITRLVHIIPTAEECAAEFAGAGSDWQAKFFNALAEHAFWPEQLQWVTNDSALTDKARELMSLIGQYAYNQTKIPVTTLLSGYVAELPDYFGGPDDFGGSDFR